jgi:hypothetical protein
MACPLDYSWPADGQLMRASLLRLSTALLVIFTAAEIFAASASAPMRVSVNVIARAILTVDSPAATIDVTEVDIARGYIDVGEPIVIRVRTNSRAGYLLQAEPQIPAFKMVELTFGDTTMTVAGTESWISRPYVPAGEVIAMHMRVHLDKGTQVGSYPLPIALSTRPL